MTLAEWLRTEKKRPSVFAREIDLSHTTVLRWIDGASVPSPAAMRKVYEATNGKVTASDLLGQVAA